MVKKQNKTNKKQRLRGQCDTTTLGTEGQTKRQEHWDDPPQPEANRVESLKQVPEQALKDS